MENVNSDFFHLKRNPIKRKNEYNETNFEYHTFMYDVFASLDNKQIIVIGPPSNNLNYENIYLLIEQNKITPTRIIDKIPNMILFFVYDVFESKTVKIGFDGWESKQHTVTPNTSQAHNFILVTKIKNENDKLDEWIRYYMMHGVDYFYIYDNNTDDRETLLNIVQKYNNITLIDWPFIHGVISDNKYSQTGSYNHALYKYCKCNYVLVCDVDEYIVPQKYFKLIDFISDNHNYSVWRFEAYWFGTNNDKVDDNYLSLTHKFMYRQSETSGQIQRTKCVFRPECIDVYGVHAPSVIKSGEIMHVNPNIVQMNHYYLFSTWRDREVLNDYCVYDSSIMKYIYRMVSIDILSNYVKMHLNLRMKFLYLQAFLEENKLFNPNDHDEDKKDCIMLYPRSYVDRINNTMNNYTDRDIDYNFMGTLFFTKTFKNRRWIIEFMQKKFSDKSYLVLTDASQKVCPKRWKEHTGGKPLGVYDKTMEHNKNNTYIPIPVNCTKYDDYIFFDNNYFNIMCRSKFTLCPAGDAPWSMRFFEAIMCKSIPILEKHEHKGRNNAEKNIGYKYYLKDEEHIYREDWVNYNYDLFIKSNTLLEM